MHSRALGLFLAVVPCLSLTGSPEPASSPGIQHSGDAYGSFARVADVVRAGKSFLVTLGTCGTLRPPVSTTNTGATVSVPPFVGTGVIDTTASATDVSGTRTTRTTATVHAVNLMSGLITANEVKAVSTTSHDSSGFHTSAAGSHLANLVVAGIPILVVPAPNTRINLAGFGHVVLNEQISNVGSSSASFVVNMLHVVVTLSNPLVPVGTDIVVAHARSELLRTDIAGVLDGFAYGTTVQLGNAFLSGRSAFVVQGCLGTNGAVETNSIASVTLPHSSTGIVTDTVSGVVNSSAASGETTSTVEALSLLSSLLTVDVIRADAHSFTDGSTFTFTDTGSRFVNLSVSGFPQITDDVPPNTRVSLAGLGTLWLKREVFTANSIEVRMIQLLVREENAYGLPIGADIRVAVARASAH